jgi:hypothetical protein
MEETVSRYVGKVKAKLSLCSSITEHHAMKAYCGDEAQLHALFGLGTI